jgi:hypothetical protein
MILLVRSLMKSNTALCAALKYQQDNTVLVNLHGSESRPVSSEGELPETELDLESETSTNLHRYIGAAFLLFGIFFGSAAVTGGANSDEL